MVIVLCLYALIVWVVFFKFKLLPYNKTWKGVIWGGAITIAFVVIGALQHYTPSSSSSAVSAFSQKIYPEVSGRVEQVFVQPSVKVAKGDKLFLIDPRPYKYDLEQKEASFRLAKIKFEDTNTLVKKDAMAKRALDANKAEMDMAEAAMKLAQYQLDNTLVKAPADGVISISTLKEGQRVSPLISVIDFTSHQDIWITANIKQNGIERIKPGQRAMVTFNISPGVIYDTEVSILPAALTQGQVYAESDVSTIDVILSARNLYPIKLAFPAEADENLRKPGSLASVTIITDEGNPVNVLAVILQWIGAWMGYIF